MGDDRKDIADWIEADDAGTAREQIEAGVKEWTPMDWKDELVERAKTDAGAPFETDMMAKLAELQRDKIAEWQRLCPRLKDAGVTIGKLERAIARSARKDGDGLQGQPLHWDEVEPCPDPVDASLPDGGAAPADNSSISIPHAGHRSLGMCSGRVAASQESDDMLTSRSRGHDDRHVLTIVLCRHGPALYARRLDARKPGPAPAPRRAPTRVASRCRGAPTRLHALGVQPALPVVRPSRATATGR